MPLHFRRLNPAGVPVLHSSVPVRTPAVDWRSLGAALFCLGLPSCCRLCSNRLLHGARIPICPSCLQAVDTPPPACTLCGKASRGLLEGICPQCNLDPPPYLGAVTTAVYSGKARELILLLKFSGIRPLAEYWAARLALAVGSQFWTFDLVVPVPLGKRRYRQRGYNQSALLAASLARRLGMRCSASALLRQRETHPQTGLLASERDRNLAGAFRADRRRVAGQAVLLVDDVLTTGATVRSATTALCRAGAESVYLATAARADLEHEPRFEACA